MELRNLKIKWIRTINQFWYAAGSSYCLHTHSWPFSPDTKVPLIRSSLLTTIQSTSKRTGLFPSNCHTNFWNARVQKRTAHTTFWMLMSTTMWEPFTWEAITSPYRWYGTRVLNGWLWLRINARAVKVTTHMTTALITEPISKLKTPPRVRELMAQPLWLVSMRLHRSVSLPKIPDAWQTSISLWQITKQGYLAR